MIKRIIKYGSIAPSGRSLSKEMSIHIHNSKEKNKIIEIGAGKGVITDEIIKKMKSGDELYVVELDNSMYELLKEKYKDYENVKVFNVDILDFNEYGFNKVVCSLPFNMFSETKNKLILSKINSITEKNTKMSFFEYLFFRNIKKGFVRMRLKVLRIKIKERIIWLNFPPAKVYIAKINIE